MLKNTILEKLLREDVGICLDEYHRLKSMKMYKATQSEVSTNTSAFRLLSVKEMARVHKSFSEGSLRHLIFHAIVSNLNSA